MYLISSLVRIDTKAGIAMALSFKSASNFESANRRGGPAGTEPGPADPAQDREAFRLH